MPIRSLIIAAHAFAGLAIAAAIWTGCALTLAADSGFAGPTIAVVKPFAARLPVCHDVRAARLLAARLVWSDGQ